MAIIDHQLKSQKRDRICVCVCVCEILIPVRQGELWPTAPAHCTKRLNRTSERIRIHKHIESSNFILAQNISVARELRLLTKFFMWYSQSFVKLHCNHYYYNLVYNVSIWHTQMFYNFPPMHKSFIVSRLLNLFN